MEYREKNIFAGVIATSTFAFFLLAAIFIFKNHYDLQILIIYCLISFSFFLTALIFTVYNIYKKRLESILP